LREPPGLLAAGGDLRPARLLAAYERGVFPWYSAQQPILWWSPDPRMVLFPEEFICSRSLGKTIRNSALRTKLDKAFADTIRGCAAPRLSGPDTWLNEEMIASYEELHELGFAHSVETYLGDKLVGGLYGIQLGRVFFGESMFSRERDASKIALAQLVAMCSRNGVAVIDCQLPSRHLSSLGARAIPRRQFQSLLREHVGAPAAPFCSGG
jgi:leucyl/phenylalanyl-tRNA---protein transferase